MLEKAIDEMKTSLSQRDEMIIDLNQWEEEMRKALIQWDDWLEDM